MFNIVEVKKTKQGAHVYIDQCVTTYKKRINTQWSLDGSVIPKGEVCERNFAIAVEMPFASQAPL